jgi:hypothetical protein
VQQPLRFLVEAGNIEKFVLIDGMNSANATQIGEI